MQLNPAILRPAASSFYSGYGSQEAAAEIYAYIAARDLSLAQAERDVTDLTLNRAFLANEVVENCLKPARSPYQSQCLPEADAIGQRTRCEAVKRRIAQLRACASVAA